MTRSVQEGALVAAVLSQASHFPVDPTVTRQGTLDMRTWENATQWPQEVFKFAVPADALMTFHGPRGSDYAAHCAHAFLSCKHKCGPKLPGLRVYTYPQGALQCKVVQLCTPAEVSFVLYRTAATLSDTSLMNAPSRFFWPMINLKPKIVHPISGLKSPQHC
jgi:hypothetical protein